MPISGYSATMPKDILEGSGVLYVGSSPLSASRGGLSFDPAKEVRNVEFDGKKSPIKQLDRTIRVVPVISGNMIQAGQSQLTQYEAGATSSFASPTAVTGVITPKKAGLLYAAADYLTNLRLVFERLDNSGFVQVRFPVAYCRKYSLKGTDGEEAEVAVEFEARLDMSVSGALINDLPYVWEGLTTP